MLSRSRKAFTLLELIVVIVILGILAALAIPTFAAVIEKARYSTAITAAEAVGREAVAIAAFDESRSGSYEVDFSDVQAADVDADKVSVVSTAIETATVDGETVRYVEVLSGDKTVFLAFDGNVVTSSKTEPGATV